MSTNPVLSQEAAPHLTSFALANVLLGFDYDGTLAPIVPTPARARMRPRTRALLERVARCYPCVVISGRALADISRRLRSIPVLYVFGNHGSEPTARPAPLERTREWIQQLQRSLPRDPAVSIEDKRHSLTVHYRGARDRHAARDAIVRAAATLRDVRVVGGSDAINLLPRDAPNKGSALTSALRGFTCDVAVYVGDDDTDEDAFAALPPERLLSIRVGPTGGDTRARFHLESQHEIDVLLDRLLALRETPHAGATGSPVRRR